MTEELDPLKRIIEGALLAAGEALTLDRLLELFEEDQRPDKSSVAAALASIQDDFAERGFALVEVASGWRFQVCSDLAPWVNRLWEEKPQKYSRALLETLALIAYRQPLTRSDIEEVRGVAVSSHIIKTLAEREWIKVVGHRDVPGRPSLYATTRQFLDYFGLKSLDELPSLGELKDIDGLNAKLNLGDQNDEADQIADAKDGLESSVDSEDDTLAQEETADLESVQVQTAAEELEREQASVDIEPDEQPLNEDEESSVVSADELTTPVDTAPVDTASVDTAPVDADEVDTVSADSNVEESKHN